MVVAASQPCLMGMNVARRNGEGPIRRTTQETGPGRSSPPTVPVAIHTGWAVHLRVRILGLSGIGPALAARIIEDRSENGPFEAPEAVTRVRGIGARTLARFRERVCTGVR